MARNLIFNQNGCGPDALEPILNVLPVAGFSGGSRPNRARGSADCFIINVPVNSTTVGSNFELAGCPTAVHHCHALVSLVCPCPDGIHSSLWTVAAGRPARFVLARPAFAHSLRLPGDIDDLCVLDVTHLRQRRDTRCTSECGSGACPRLFQLLRHSARGFSLGLVTARRGSLRCDGDGAASTLALAESFRHPNPGGRQYCWCEISSLR